MPSGPVKGVQVPGTPLLFEANLSWNRMDAPVGMSAFGKKDNLPDSIGRGLEINSPSDSYLLLNVANRISSKHINSPGPKSGVSNPKRIIAFTVLSGGKTSIFFLFQSIHAPSSLYKENGVSSSFLPLASNQIIPVSNFSLKPHWQIIRLFI